MIGSSDNYMMACWYILRYCIMAPVKRKRPVLVSYPATSLTPTDPLCPVVSDPVQAVATLRQGIAPVVFLRKSAQHQAAVSRAVEKDAPLMFGNYHNQCVLEDLRVEPPSVDMLRHPEQHWEQWRQYLTPGRAVMNLASGMLNLYEGHTAVAAKFASPLVLETQSAIHDVPVHRLRVWNNRMRVTIPDSRTPRGDVPNSIHVEGGFVGQWPPRQCDVGMIDGISHTRSFVFWVLPPHKWPDLAALYASKGGTKSHFVKLDPEDCRGLGARRYRVEWDPTYYLMVFNNNGIHELDNVTSSVSMFHSFYSVDEVPVLPSPVGRTWMARNLYHPPEFAQCTTLAQTLLMGFLFYLPGSHWPSGKETCQSVPLYATGVWLPRVTQRYHASTKAGVPDRVVRYLLPEHGTEGHSAASRKQVRDAGMDVLADFGCVWESSFPKWLRTVQELLALAPDVQVAYGLRSPTCY